MAVDVELDNITSGFRSASVLQSNNDKIEAGFSDAFSRTNNTNNALEVPLDLGLNNLFNVAELDVDTIRIQGVDATEALKNDLQRIKDITEEVEQNAAHAESAAINSFVSSQESESSAQDSATSAAEALTSENNAKDSETKAQEWATNPEDVEVEPGLFSALHHSAKSSGFATDSANSATASANSATESATSASNAATSETNAANSATDSQASAAASATSAAASQASLEEFQGIYYGALASDPATDPNGNAPTAGDKYFNTSSNTLKIFDGNVWVEPQVSPLADNKLSYMMVGLKWENIYGDLSGEIGLRRNATSGNGIFIGGEAQEAIQRSFDYGKTWDVVQLPVGSSFLTSGTDRDNNGTSTYLGDGVFVFSTFIFSSDTQGGVWRTEDNGATWTAVEIPGITTGQSRNVSLGYTKQTGVLVAITSLSSAANRNTEGVEIFWSGDKGLTWSKITTVPTMGRPSTTTDHIAEGNDRIVFIHTDRTETAAVICPDTSTTPTVQSAVFDSGEAMGCIWFSPQGISSDDDPVFNIVSERIDRRIMRTKDGTTQLSGFFPERFNTDLTNSVFRVTQGDGLVLFAIGQELHYDHISNNLAAIQKVPDPVSYSLGTYNNFVYENGIFLAAVSGRILSPLRPPSIGV